MSSQRHLSQEIYEKAVRDIQQSLEGLNASSNDEKYKQVIQKLDYIENLIRSMNQRRLRKRSTSNSEYVNYHKRCQ